MMEHTLPSVSSSVKWSKVSSGLQSNLGDEVKGLWKSPFQMSLFIIFELAGSSTLKEHGVTQPFLWDLASSVLPHKQRLTP